MASNIRISMFAAILFVTGCSEPDDIKGCYECSTSTTITQSGNQETTTLKADRCDLTSAEAIQLQISGTFTREEVVDGVNVRTEQTVTCERKNK